MAWSSTYSPPPSRYSPSTYSYTPGAYASSGSPLTTSYSKRIADSSDAKFTMSGGGKLAQEIHDEFLCCKICLEGFKNPKCLNCLHTFCENCIESHAMSEGSYKKYSDYREFTCPLCRKRTQLPIGGVKKLPDNFLVSSLSEVVGRQRPSKFPFCDICKTVNRKHREASSKCLDCNKLLCASCVDIHRDTKVTKDHSIFDVEIEKDIECKEHKDEVVRFYCEPCEACVCVLCTFNEHKDHDISQFNEAVAKYKQDIEDNLNNCKDKMDKLDSNMDQLNNCDKTIKKAEQKIRDQSINMISEIRTREKALIDELHNIYGKEVMEAIENKHEVQGTIEGLRSTCNLTELILKGKDIELLLLKKQVSEKLGTLNDLDMSDLPQAVEKQVQFIPGALDMGYLQDMDRPLLSSMRARRAFTESLSGFTAEDASFIHTSETQTDEELMKDFMMEKTSMTDPPKTHEKGVTVRCESRTSSAQTDPVAVASSPIVFATEHGSSQELSYTPTGSVTVENGTPSSSTSPPTARRQRRRRERAQTTHVEKGDLPSQQQIEGPTAQEATVEYFATPRSFIADGERASRRMRRQRMIQANSVEDYYSAESPS